MGTESQIIVANLKSRIERIISKYELALSENISLKEQLQKAFASAKKEMERAAAELDFIRAAKFRDEMKYLGELISKK